MYDYLKSFNVLTDNEIVLALKLFKNKTIKKGEYFIKSGKICSEVAFVQSGFFRSFYYNQNDREITYCFTFNGGFITAYSSFITQQKTIENIYAMTDAEVLSISYQDLVQLEQNSPNWLKLTQIFAQQEFLKMEQRVFSLLGESAENKYLYLLQQYPQYLQLISLSQLASYLGITQRHLSRIRKSIMI